MLRHDLKVWILDNRRVVAEVLAYAAGIVVLFLCLAMWWPGSNDFLQGLFAGITVTVMVATLLLAFVLHTNNVPRLTGAFAEDVVDAELNAAAKARQIHGYVSHITLDGYDIDAVAITAAGVVAIEAKWHGKLPTQQQVSRDVASAKAAQAKTRAILYSLHRASTPVTGVLVVHGPQAQDLGEGVTVDGVDIVPAGRLREWLRRSAAGVFDHAEGWSLRELLEEFARTHGPERVSRSD